MLSQLCSLFLAMLHSAELAVLRISSEYMVIKEGQSVNLECSKKQSSSSAMYWYMLPSEKNSSLTLLVSAFEGGNAAVEKGFESHFKSSNIKGDSITLSIEQAFLNDSGTYYCAESEHSGETQDLPSFHLLIHIPFTFSKCILKIIGYVCKLSS
uniref:Ig-like domain-containing protein n=1 Tax=Ficedula albicollis TaxID=59894 RepID=A0A803VCA8_FICAL